MRKHVGNAIIAHADFGQTIHCDLKQEREHTGIFV